MNSKMHIVLVMVVALLIYQLYFDLRILKQKFTTPPFHIKDEYENYLENFTNTKSVIHSIHEFNITPSFI